MAALAEASSQLVPGFVFEGHPSWVWCVTSHEEGEGGPENLRLLTSSDDGYVGIWGDGPCGNWSMRTGSFASRSSKTLRACGSLQARGIGASSR
jgi:WD40 repeat protein